jgi:hypothetical protein
VRKPEFPFRPKRYGYWTQRFSFWEATWLVFVGCAGGILMLWLTGQLDLH